MMSRDADRGRSGFGLSPSDDRPTGRVALCRFGIGCGGCTCSALPIPLDPCAQGKGHCRQKRHCQGEARQDRLHGKHLDDRTRALDPGNRAVFRGRPLALRPRLTTGLPWTVDHHEANIASDAKIARRGSGEPCADSTSEAALWGQCADATTPPAIVRRARFGQRRPAAARTVRDRASRQIRPSPLRHR